MIWALEWKRSWSVELEMLNKFIFSYKQYSGGSYRIWRLSDKKWRQWILYLEVIISSYSYKFCNIRGKLWWTRKLLEAPCWFKSLWGESYSKWMKDLKTVIHNVVFGEYFELLYKVCSRPPLKSQTCNCFILLKPQHWYGQYLTNM